MKKNKVLSYQKLTLKWLKKSLLGRKKTIKDGNLGPQKEKKNRVTKNTGKDSEVFFLSFLNYI